MKRLTAICVAAVCSLGMMLNGEANATARDAELCNWGKWAYTQGIKLEGLVDTLNSVEAMPYEDKTIIVACYVASMETV